MALPPDNSQNRPDKTADRAAAQQDVLLREIDEAVRQDQLADAARQYGRPVLAFLVAGLAAFAGYLWWHDRQETRLEEASEGLIRALDQVDAGNLDAGTKALLPVTEAGDEGAKAASRLLKAGIALQQGRKPDAIALYAAVAADGNAPKPYRDVAAIREVAANFDAMKPEDVISRLKPLAVPGDPWFGSAGELVGIAYLKQGKTELAGPLFAAIAKAKDVPDSLRSRARQMSGLLGVDAVVDVNEFVGAAGEAGSPADAAAKE